MAEQAQVLIPNAHWLEAVSAIDPDLGKPELWQDTQLIEEVIFKSDATHKLVHAMVLNIMAHPDMMEGAIATCIMLGYFMGMNAHKKAN